MTTFFSHFVGGTDGNEIKPLVKELKNAGITAMVIYNAEDDITGNKTEKKESISNKDDKSVLYFHENEKKCDMYVQDTLNCIDTASGIIDLFYLFII